jgi:membrane-bound lytic murein transglycosylase B
MKPKNATLAISLLNPIGALMLSNLRSLLSSLITARQSHALSILPEKRISSRYVSEGFAGMTTKTNVVTNKSNQKNIIQRFRENILSLLIFLSASLLLSPACTLADPAWDPWVQDLRRDALAQGVSAEHFDTVFKTVQPRQDIQQLENQQPEQTLSYLQYRDSLADAGRISLGRREYRRHHQLLEKIGREYQVDPCMIAALWGLETSYGRFLGKYDVITALASLSYHGKRKAFFRKELLFALKILEQGHIEREQFRGQWAGASGLPQFLPSSWYHFAVDFTGDGKKNIWTDLPDALASIANYLAKNGWKYRQPVLLEVTLPDETARQAQDLQSFIKQGLQSEKPIATEWLSLGARLLRMQGGPDYVVFANFNTLMKYNHSTYYASTVAYLATQICFSEATSPEGDKRFEESSP